MNRSHFDRHEKAKEAYHTLDDAQGQADYLNKWKRKQWHYPTEAYACNYCAFFHVGSRRFGTKITRRQVFMGEIGERAYREMVFENRGSPRKRFRRILSRIYKGNPELLKALYTREEEEPV